MTELHDSYAAMKASFRADLEAAAAEHGAVGAPGGPRRRRVRLQRVVAGSAVAALAATALVLALGSGPAERLDVVARAEAALAPKPGIQHLRLRTYADYRIDGKPIEFDEGNRPPEGATLVERWATAELGTYRSTTIEPGVSGGPTTTYEDARRNGPTGKRDDVAKTYIERTNSMEIITRIPKGLRKYDTGGFHWGPNGDERLEDLREMLADGRLQDRGVAVVAGRPTRRLVGEKTYPDAPPLTFEYFVDAVTFAPVRMVQVWRVRLDGNQGQNSGKLQTTKNTFDFEVYEHLPATDANEQQLDFTPPAGTTITSRRYRENPRDATKRHERDGFDPEEIAAGAAAAN